jgi:hypothetical protein
MKNPMPNSLIPNRFLFRFSLPCLYREQLWTAEGAGLEERFCLANFAELEGRVPIADVRAAWNESGLAFSVRVSGKRQAPWCRATKPEDSDCFQVWIDARNVHNVHRATRYCHRLIFLPTGDGRNLEEPMAQLLPINRAKELPRPIQPNQLNVHGIILSDGYLLDAHISGDALTGFDPQEHPQLGFTYAVIDRELGEQTLTVGSPMPYQEDPSLWATLELVK